MKLKPRNKFVYHTGSVLDGMRTGKYDMFAHGCNCFKTMGAGVAVQVRNDWPWLYQADLDFGLKPEDRLGNCSFVQRGYKFYFNLYTQYDHGAGRNLNYGSIISSFDRAFNIIDEEIEAYQPLIAVCLPRIGAGLAGGNWLIIEEMLMYHDFDRSVEFHVYDLDKRKF